MAAIVAQGLSVASTLGSFLGGSNKNALRDQQEKDRLARAQAGSVTDAQGIYHDSLPQNKQPAERIKDDQANWSILQSQGWTVDSSGTVHPPAAARSSGAGGWTASAPASMTGRVTYTSSGGDVASPMAPAAGGLVAATKGHAVAFAALATLALIAIVFMFRHHFS